MSQPSDLVAVVDAAVCGSEDLQLAWAATRKLFLSFDALSWLALEGSERDEALSVVSDTATRTFLKTVITGKARRLGE